MKIIKLQDDLAPSTDQHNCDIYPKPGLYQGQDGSYYLVSKAAATVFWLPITATDIFDEVKASDNSLDVHRLFDQGIEIIRALKNQ